jgi:hypothetical protein
MTQPPAAAAGSFRLGDLDRLGQARAVTEIVSVQNRHAPGYARSDTADVRSPGRATRPTSRPTRRRAALRLDDEDLAVLADLS